MNHATAILLAQLMDGKAHHTGGNIFTVRIERRDGSVVEVGADGVDEYADLDACYDGRVIHHTAIDIQDVGE